MNTLDQHTERLLALKRSLDLTPRKTEDQSTLGLALPTFKKDFFNVPYEKNGRLEAVR